LYIEKSKRRRLLTQLDQSDLPDDAVRIAGTSLWFFGKAPRLSVSNRHSTGWFWRQCCGSIKEIRVADVKPHTKISCGCVGRRLFIEHHERCAADLPEVTRRRISGLKYAKMPWTRRYQQRLNNAGIARLLSGRSVPPIECPTLADALRASRRLYKTQ
jgi:hypothetical protein